ncbi:serine hydrolase domain-containing protein [Nonomuraea sp. NPDC002799]
MAEGAIMGSNLQKADQFDAGRKRFQAVSDTLRASASAEGVPGAAVAVLFDDDEIQVAYYGLDNRDSDKSRCETSRQPVTCLAKVLIAYVTLMFVDKNLVSLDEPLGRLLPEAVRRRGNRTVEITLRHVLSHTSGIDDSYERWATNDSSDLASYVQRFENYPQIAEPGEVFAYSDAGTAIAALLIEKLSGMPWRRAVNTMLLQPLGITDLPESSGPVDYGGSVATGYILEADSQSYQPVGMDMLLAANDNLDTLSVCFTLEDAAMLARFALDDGVTGQGRRLLSVGLAKQMRTRQMVVPDHHLIHSWGLGWMHFDEASFGFEASGPGYHNFIQIFPERRLALVLQANVYPGFVLYYDVLGSLAGEPWADPAEQPMVDINLCEGVFQADGFRLEVIRGHEHLRYRYFRRRSEDEWLEYDFGNLVPSGARHFSVVSAKKVLRGAITPLWSDKDPEPKFIRWGQRLLRRENVS